MTPQTAQQSLEVARGHLRRVQEASFEPTDWTEEYLEAVEALLSR